MTASRSRVRLLYQMATAKQNTELGQAEVDRRLAVLRKLVPADVAVDIATPKDGPGAIENRIDSALAVPALMDGVVRAERQGYDAVIISCFGDPGLDACRELVSIPVTASGQAAMHVAAQLGARFSIIAPNAGGGSRRLENPRKYGFATHYASTRGSGLSVMDLACDRDRTLDRLTEVGRRAVEEDGADTLILGCMSMAFHGVDRALSTAIGVPVVNPIPASLMFAELLARSGISHSPLAYPRADRVEA